VIVSFTNSLIFHSPSKIRKNSVCSPDDHKPCAVKIKVPKKFLDKVLKNPKYTLSGILLGDRFRYQLPQGECEMESKPEERKKRVGISGSYGGLNMGDEAILTACAARCRLKSRYSHATLKIRASITTWIMSFRPES
jgi:hypothetical protein